MKVLLLAPQPFYQERGTPIAVNMLLRALSQRGDKVDVLTYHEGADVHHAGVVIHRIPRLPFMRNIRPGLSLKKVFCDAVMTIKAIRMVRRRSYDVIHAVEESVFIAALIRLFLRIPYVYDMDSSLPRQVMDKFRVLSMFALLMTSMEGAVVRNAEAVVAVCDELELVARKHKAKKVFVLRDVSLIEDDVGDRHGQSLLAGNIPPCGCRFMYIGNLETYQGIDLLLDSFRRVLRKAPDAQLVIVGGVESDIERYRYQCRTMGIAERVVFLGRCPVSSLGLLARMSDVLVSPRIAGANTPMKIYSYMASGKAILATALPTHTQVLSSDNALLSPPEPGAFADAMLRLANDAGLRLQLGDRAREQSRRGHSLETFEKRVGEIYAWLENRLHPLK